MTTTHAAAIVRILGWVEPADAFERRVWRARQRAWARIHEPRLAYGSVRRLSADGLAYEETWYVASGSQPDTEHVCTCRIDKRPGAVHYCRIACDCTGYLHSGVCTHQLVVARMIRQEHEVVRAILADHAARERVSTGSAA